MNLAFLGYLSPKLASLLQHKLAIPTLLFGLLTITLTLYFPGLYGDFIFDDYINVVTNDDAHLERITPGELGKVASSGVASTLTRPISMLSFGINYYLTGLDPFYFKLTNLLVHLLVTVGVYLLSVELINMTPMGRHSARRSLKLLALAAAACWALHPLNVSTVLYVVQRMTQLSALATVFTLLYYCRFRQRTTCSRSEGIIALGVVALGIVAGVLCKENAVLAVPLILCIEFYFLRFHATTEGHALFLKLFMALLVVLPGLGAIAILVFAPERLIGGYEFRDFTMGERLLSEGRVIWLYIKWLLMPDLRELTFYYDNYAISRSLLSPSSTLFGVSGVVGLLLLCILARKRLPVLCFGIAFFLVAHAMEGTIIPLELVFEHRNYLPSIGLMFGLIYSLLNAGFVLRKQAAAVLLAVYVLFLGQGTFEEARKWSSTQEHLLTIVRQNPDSHRINYNLGFFLLTVAANTPEHTELLDLAAHYYDVSGRLNANTIRGQVGVIMANSQNDKPIDPEVVNELYARIRTTPHLSNFVTEIGSLTHCRFSGFCQFDNDILVGMFNAIAQNRNSDPFVVQGMLAQMADQFVRVLGRKEDGKAIYYLARDIRPGETTFIDLELVQLEHELGDVEQARRLLAELNARADAVQRYSEDLKQLERLLDKGESGD